MSGLTRPVARSHKMIETGRAMIYRTPRVKLKNMKRFPTKPQASETALRTISLGVINFPDEDEALLTTQLIVDVSPMRVGDANLLGLFIGLDGGRYLVPPCAHQRHDGHHVCGRASCCSHEGDCC
jgi:hypothetical protein